MHLEFCLWRDSPSVEGFFAVKCSMYSLVMPLGKGVGREEGSCLQSGGSGEEVLQGAQRKEGGFGGGVFFGDQVELSDLLC